MTTKNIQGIQGIQGSKGIPFVLETIVQSLVPIKRNAFPWVDDQPTKEDLDHIFNQTSDEFDALKLKDEMLADLRSGKATLVTKRGPYAKLLAVVYPGTVIPWELFGDIFVAFGQAKRTEAKQSKANEAKQSKTNSWRIVWFAHPQKRLLPTKGEVAPEHVNGGYTHTCVADTIVIYREEEVCRVLVHELLHAACTDDPSLPVAHQEVYTETWAELFLIAILAKGSVKKAASLWKKQAQWIADQEYVLRNYGVTESSYGWRYTIGRRQVLASLGIPLPPVSANASTNGSLRFTYAGV
jgi:hypothetical protein